MWWISPQGLILHLRSPKQVDVVRGFFLAINARMKNGWFAPQMVMNNGRETFSNFLSGESLSKWRRRERAPRRNPQGLLSRLPSAIEPECVSLQISWEPPFGLSKVIFLHQREVFPHLLTPGRAVHTSLSRAWGWNRCQVNAIVKCKTKFGDFSLIADE